MKIIIAEKISAAALEQLKEPGWTVLTAEQLDGKLPDHLESADALIVRSAVQADAALLSHAKKLRVIGRAGVGVDNIDLDAATRQGIAVMNTPGANAVAVAEQTLGMMLAMARHLCRADALMRQILPAGKRRGHGGLEFPRAEQPADEPPHRAGLGVADDEGILRITTEEDLISHQNVQVAGHGLRRRAEPQFGWLRRVLRRVQLGPQRHAAAGKRLVCVFGGHM